MDEVIVTDSKGNKKTVEGNIEEFVIKRPALNFFKPTIYIDYLWGKKSVLCILIGNPNTVKLGENITITDNKNNKKTIEGNIEGVMVRKPIFIFGSTKIRVDNTWFDNRVLCVLLEKPEEK